MSLKIEGRLDLIIGPMFSGKSTELIRKIRLAKIINKKVLVIKPIIDIRYKNDKIVSHSFEQEECLTIEKLKDIDHFINQYDLIIVDEGQFFPDLFQYVTMWADTLPVHIVIAGLDGTSERKPFGDMLRLIPHAEEVERLEAFCSVCGDGTIANYSQYKGLRSVENGANTKEEVVIGGTEVYRPVCRKHYLE